MDTPADIRQMKSSKRHPRRNFLISPAFQWRYVGIAVAAVFVVAELMTLVLFTVLHQQARARALGTGLGHAWENTWIMILAAFTFAAAMGLGFGIWTVFITHRIAGPMHVVEQCLREFAQGRFPRRRQLRRKDEFKSFYDSFWWAMESVRDRHREQLAAMARLVESASSASNATDDARRRALATIASDLDGLRWEIIRDLGITDPTELSALPGDSGDASAADPSRSTASSSLRAMLDDQSAL